MTFLDWFLALIVLLLFAILLMAWRRPAPAGPSARERELERLIDDLTAELGKAREMLARAGTLDVVTGLANHREFQEFLRREWRRALRDASAISLIMIDVDHFRDYNDEFGHAGGDAGLRKIAEALAATLRRPSDLVARYGGEEFGVVLGRTDADGAYRLAHRLQGSVEALALPNPRAPGGGNVSVSVGVATATPAIDSNWEELELVAAADRALSEAKAAGRNQIIVAAAAPPERA